MAFMRVSQNGLEMHFNEPPGSGWFFRQASRSNRKVDHDAWILINEFIVEQHLLSCQ